MKFVTLNKMSGYQMLNNLKHSNSLLNTKNEFNKMILKIRPLEEECKVLFKRIKASVMKSEMPNKT